MNTSNKTLLQILVEELPKRGGWPNFKRKLQAVQDADGEIKFHIIGLELVFERNNPGNWGSDHESAWLLWQVRETGDLVSNPNINCVTLASDYATAIITRDQYEAALEASKETLTGTGVDGWIDWAGGDCPVESCAVVDVMFRYLENSATDHAGAWRWNHNGTDSDIIAYRLHQPQDANSRANDDRLAHDAAFEGVSLRHRRDGFKTPEASSADLESDLNDCIGQTPEDTTLLMHFLLDEINDADVNMRLDDAYELAQHLISVGYRKQ